MKHGPMRTIAAALLVLAAASSEGFAGPSATIDPGFVPQTGQINPGHAPAPWSATPALPQDRQPSEKAARAALLTPDQVGVSSLGETPQPPNAAGTTGAGPAMNVAPPGPIGATLQTMPAKYSPRNDLLDHLPVMAWPLPLNDQQRQQIYRAVMAESGRPVVDIERLKPASALSFKQERDLRPLPNEVAGIDGLKGLKYLRDKDKALLIQPANGIVVDEITK